MANSEPILDLEYLNAISDNDSKFKYEVLEIFLTNTPPAVDELYQLVFNTSDLKAMYRQAHYLKSGFSVIRVSNIIDLLINIEKLTSKDSNIDIIREITEEINNKFYEAIPHIEAEKDKNRC